jgi:hypothetical protein
MRRSGWSRFLAGALTIWFGLVMAAPLVLHSCPQALATRSASGHAGMHEHHASHSSSSRNPQAPKECTCLGQCRGPVPATLPRAVTAPNAAAPQVAAGPTMPAETDRPTSLPDHTQPFATAPPLPQA